MKKKTIALFFALMIMASGTGCQAIKRIFVKPPPEGVVESSYPIAIDGYQSTVVVKATPKELTDYITDLPRLLETSRAMGLFQLKIEDSVPDMKPIKVGQSIGITVKILGLSLPCRIIVFDYKPDKELWLMLITEGSWAWLLARIKIKPVQEGSMVSVNAFGRVPETLGTIIDTLQLAYAASARIDLWMAIVQTEFDPSLDVKEVTGKGLRGESYKKFFQANEASVWINAGPEEVVEWMADNFESYLPEIKMSPHCPSLAEFLNMPEGDVMYCPADLEFLNLNFDASTFFIQRKKVSESIYRMYFQGLGEVGWIRVTVAPETGGTRVQGRVAIEIPGSTSPQIMDIMVALGAIPKHLRRALLDIKQGVEGTG
jgi:hypothetical protein